MPVATCGYYLESQRRRLDATDEEVMAAAEKARCGEFLSRLEKGLHTMAGDGGKQQRISLARAILKNAPTVVLDEATASVDADNESCIQQAISELRRARPCRPAYCRRGRGRDFPASPPAAVRKILPQA